jgi:hypothetical protein
MLSGFRMMQLSWACLLLAVSAANAETVAVNKPPPPAPSDEALGFYNNTRDELLQNVKRVGLVTTRLPDDMEDRDDIRAALQTLAQKYFEKAGMEFVKTDVYDAIYDRINHQIGGTFDPKTGAPKPAERSAVLDNALQEFFEKEKLDAVVLLSVRDGVAQFAGGNAVWNGVTEYCDGKEPMKFMNASGCGSTGRLPEVSLLVQIFSKQKKALYGKFGGIQLRGYFNSDAARVGESNFFRVPSAKLLTDERRLERAMRIATLALVETPQKIALIENFTNYYDPERVNPKLLPPLPKAERPNQSSNDMALPREQIVQSAHFVLLTPMTAWDLQVPDDIRTRLTENIRAEFAKLGWEVLVADGAVAKEWYKTPAANKPFYDPFTGKRDIAAMRSYRSSLINVLSPDKVPDAIIWPSIRRISVSQVSGEAKWDGTGQSALTLGPLVQAFWQGTTNIQAGEGFVPASTLLITLNAPDDTEMYKGRGGIELLGQAKINSQTSYGAIHYSTIVTDRAPAELFKDNARIDAAAHIALRKLTLTPAELQAELYPKKK